MITVLMATRNRAAILEKVLNSYTRLNRPAGGWEAIVVDNGSSDATPDVVRRFADRLPLAYVAEPRAGKSWAVNAGLRHAKGDLILFTDDDILPAMDWLVDYAAAAASQPDFDLFGGPVRLAWPCEPPDWAICDFTIKGACFANSDPSIGSGPCVGTLIGGNFAVRASAVAEQGGFDSLIGPQPGSYIMGNEAEFIERLGGAGHKAWWIADAMTEHIVRPEQVSREWVLRRAIKFGRGEYAREVKFNAPPKFIAGLPRWVVRKAGEQLGRVAMACVLGNAQERFVKRWYLNYYWGMLLQARQIRRREGGRQRRNES
jgi:glycosyltransferase involved in cell wall biosynthesis